MPGWRDLAVACLSGKRAAARRVGSTGGKAGGEPVKGFADERLQASGPGFLLQLCADLANGSKHFTLRTTRTGDKSTAIIRNGVDVRLGTGVSHRFYVQSNGTEYDVLDIAEAGRARDAVSTGRGDEGATSHFG